MRYAEQLYRNSLYQHQLQSSYRKLHSRYQLLLQRLNSRKNQLLCCDWRSLRGIPFERFLLDVFEALGYSVQMTPPQDLGVDLIVTTGVDRIAIQAKGYSGSVSLQAVQEVTAGMAKVDPIV